MAAVTKWLFRAFATAAPEIVFTLYQILHVGEFLGDYGF
jgi:hypothetical protein